MKASVKWGLYGGILAGLIMFLNFIPSFYQSALGIIAGYLPALLLLILLYFAIRETRDKEMHNFDMLLMLKSGIAAGGVFVLVYSIFTYIFWSAPPADYIAFMVAKNQEFLLSKNIAANDVALRIEDFRKSLAPAKQIPTQIFFFIVFSMMGSVIFSFILRK